MAESKIVQIRKKGGLDKLMKSKNGQTLNPMLFKTNSKDPRVEGRLEGEYKGRTIIDTKHFLSPMWNDMKKRWSFAGTTEDLVRLVRLMKLKYPKGHKMAGMLIQPLSKEDSPSGEDYRLSNRTDEVFNNSELYGKYYMENGRIGLDLNDPKQEFIFLCYKGDTSVDDRSGDKPKSSFMQAGTKYEIISPKREAQKQKGVVNKKLKAGGILASMENDEPKMRAIAVIMQLPGYSKSTDANGVFVLLNDNAVENTKHSSKFNKTFQERFIELGELPDEDLNITLQIINAKLSGIIRQRNGSYNFNGETLPNLDNDVQLVNFFRSPANQDKYIQLLDLIENEK